MEKYTIILISLGISLLISLILVITFAVLKSKNDEYIETQRKSNSEYTNNYSETYFALMITFLVLFVFSALSLIIFFAKKVQNDRLKRPETPENYKPLLPNKYDSSLETTPKTPDDSTPLGLSGGSNYLGEVRGSGIKKLEF